MHGRPRRGRPVRTRVAVLGPREVASDTFVAPSAGHPASPRRAGTASMRRGSSEYTILPVARPQLDADNRRRARALGPSGRPRRSPPHGAGGLGATVRSTIPWPASVSELPAASRRASAFRGCARREPLPLRTPPARQARERTGVTGCLIVSAGGLRPRSHCRRGPRSEAPSEKRRMVQHGGTRDEYMNGRVMVMAIHRGGARALAHGAREGRGPVSGRECSRASASKLKLGTRTRHGGRVRGRPESKRRPLASSCSGMAHGLRAARR